MGGGIGKMGGRGPVAKAGRRGASNMDALKQVGNNRGLTAIEQKLLDTSSNLDANQKHDVAFMLESAKRFPATFYGEDAAGIMHADVNVVGGPNFAFRPMGGMVTVTPRADIRSEPSLTPSLVRVGGPITNAMAQVIAENVEYIRDAQRKPGGEHIRVPSFSGEDGFEVMWILDETVEEIRLGRISPELKAWREKHGQSLDASPTEQKKNFAALIDSNISNYQLTVASVETSQAQANVPQRMPTTVTAKA